MLSLDYMDLQVFVLSLFKKAVPVLWRAIEPEPVTISVALKKSESSVLFVLVLRSVLLVGPPSEN